MNNNFIENFMGYLKGILKSNNGVIELNSAFLAMPESIGIYEARAVNKIVTLQGKSYSPSYVN